MGPTEPMWSITSLMPAARRTRRKRRYQPVRRTRYRQTKLTKWRKAVRKIAVQTIRKKAETNVKKTSWSLPIAGGGTGTLYGGALELLQGTGDNERVGNKARIVGFHAQGRLISPQVTIGGAPVAGRYLIRFMVLLSGRTDLTVADFPTDVHACVDKDKLPGHLIRDFIYPIQSFTASGADLLNHQRFKMWVPLSTQVEFDDSNAIPKNKKLYFYMLCSDLSATQHIDIDGCYRTFFKEF